MKILMVLVFIAILASLGMALFYMMRGGKDDNEDAPTPRSPMPKALAARVGLSIALFMCVLLAWAMGWIEPTGIPAGA